MNSQILFGDCLEVMENIESKSVDLIISDLPYGITNCDWDKIIPFDLMWKNIKRVRKEITSILLFGKEPFSSRLRMSNFKEYRYDWYWDKKKSGNPLIAKYVPHMVIENVCVFYKKAGQYFPIKEKKEYRKNNFSYVQKSNGILKNFKSGIFKYSDNYDPYCGYPKNIINISVRSKEMALCKRLHSTQKPVSLIEYFIKTYSKEEDTVLDFCAGSGTTGFACYKLKRNYILIEKNKGFYDIIVERMDKVKKEFLLI